jgi:rare lipoprotein A
MKLVNRALALALLAAFPLLSGCGAGNSVSHYVREAVSPSPSVKSEGNYKVGKPYRVGSVWYYPREDFSLVETGIASWYGPDFHGKNTANGEKYDQNELTAAHRTLQLPSFVRVTNLENGRSVVVRINDRGPYLHGRIIDLSRRGAELLGYIGKGTARVRVEVLEQESRQLAAIARKGGKVRSLAELRSGVAPYVEPAPIPVSAEGVPESLMTPTITVEELRQAAPAPAPAPAPVAMHMNRGVRLPEPTVSRAPVAPTGIFVQAGSFAVRANAEALGQKLSTIAPFTISPVQVNGKTLYRLRLGPFDTVPQADAVLSRVIRSGGGGARVVSGSN